MRRGIVFVVSGPSGVGKSTILRRVLEADPRMRFSVSHTTRRRREGEQDGVHYHFVDVDQFQRLIAQHAFLEHAVYQDNHYGTSHEAVLEPTRAGHDLILEVEIQGAQQLQERLPDAVRIFIAPPSLDVLGDRLRERKTESADTLEWRLARAREEMDYANACDHRIVNESVDKAVDDFLRIVQTARKERG